MLVSIVMPVHNERATLEEAVRRLGRAGIPSPWELVVVDDGSTDASTDGLTSSWASAAERIVLIRSERNRGKGAAVRRGLLAARGEILGIHDADLEYDPTSIAALVDPILADDADVVFGSRQFGANASYSYWYTLGNRAISTAASMLFDRVITDAYTCQKYFRRDCLDPARLSATGFEIEAELVGLLLGGSCRYREVPIPYTARGRAEGKKIRATDGIIGIERLVRTRFARR